MHTTRLNFQQPKSLADIHDLVESLNTKLTEQITSQPATDHGTQYAIIIRPLTGDHLSQAVIDELHQLSGDFDFTVN